MKEFLNKNREFIAYIIVGVLTTVVAVGAYWLCVSTFLDASDGFQLQVANVISWILAVAFAYVTNRKFVFHSKNKDVAREIAQFVGARLVTLLIDMGMMFAFVTVLGFNDKIIKIIAQFVVVLVNYVFSKLVIFVQKEEK